MTSVHRKNAKLPYGMELHNGDCMLQKEFHRIYDEMPEGFRAELIGGTVYISEPLGLPHGKHHVRLSSLLDAYGAATPGLEVCDNTSVILGEEDEVQPDLFLRILPEYKGQSGNTRPGRNVKAQYVKGAPELVAEIAFSSKAIDLHLKKQRYLQAGVIEYVVVCLEPLHIVWLDLRAEKVLQPNEADVYRSAIFPGLWVHGKALLTMDYQLTMGTLAQGLASREHAEFVQRLAAERS